MGPKNPAYGAQLEKNMKLALQDLLADTTANRRCEKF
jgi:hypothetical protein